MHPTPDDPVFTLAALHALGWTRSAIRHAVHIGRVSRLRQGIYCLGPPTQRLRVLAAAAAYPAATVSHRSGLHLHTLPVVGAAFPLPELTVPPRASVTMPGVWPHRATLGPTDRTIVDGAAVTCVERTLVDVARNVETTTAVVAIDAALHRGLVAADDLNRVLEECAHWPGISKARRACGLADARAESPLESVSRLAFPRLGLPAPQPQMLVFDEYGNFLGRSDFCWAELGVIGEADGLQKYRDPSDPDALVREKMRQEAFERTGLAVARWGWDEAWHPQPALRRRIQSAFDRAAARDRAGLPRRWIVRPAA